MLLSFTPLNYLPSIELGNAFVNNGRVAYSAMQQGAINDYDIPHYPAFVAPPAFHPIPPPPIVTAPIVPAGVRLGRHMIGERAAPTAEEEDNGVEYDSDSASDEDNDGEDSETDEEVERYQEGGDDDYDYNADREGYESS